MTKAEGKVADELAEKGYGGIEKALRAGDVRGAVSAGRKASDCALEAGDHYTSSDLRLLLDALATGYCWEEGDSCTVGGIRTNDLLRSNGYFDGVEKYLLHQTELGEGACGQLSGGLLSDALSGLRKYLHSVLSFGFIGVGLVGLRASVTGNVVVGSVVSDGYGLSVLFLVVGLFGLFLQIRKKKLN